MGDLANILKDFFRRDFALVVGGGVLAASFLYLFDRLEQVLAYSGSLVVGFLLLGVSYSIGYAVQALFELYGVVRTAPPRHLSRLDNWCYRRFESKPWTTIPEDFDFTAAWVRLQADQRRLCERIIALKMIGTAIGPSLLLASALVLWRFLSVRGTSFDGYLALVSVALGLILIQVGRFKAAQQAQFCLTYGAVSSA